MTSLTPQPPFVWPEPRVIAGTASYKQEPPYDAFALTSQSLYGVVTDLTERGIEALWSWLKRNTELRACLVVVVYPACPTRPQDLARLLDLVQEGAGRLSVRVHPLDRVTDRATNALCFLASSGEVAHVVAGPTEDIGLAPRKDGHANFVFQADPALVESFRRYFDWLWAYSRDLSARGVTQIPVLVLPEGSEEGRRRWRAYVDECSDASLFDDALAQVDPDTGDVVLLSEDGTVLVSPTEEIGFKKLDPLAERITRLYSKGALVSIDKLSKVPPLDAPLDPSAFGDSAELHRGNVVRKVSMRVSIIDETTLKEIDKRRQGLRTLLTKFTFGLADNMRWMPATARDLFESELHRLNAEGQGLISNLLKGDVAAFIANKRERLAADLDAMYAELGRAGQVTTDTIEQVMDNLKGRLIKAQSASFLPTLSYSGISFAITENAFASPWGQAFAFLQDIASFPRKALTDSFFFRGLTISEESLIEVMNVADDVLLRDMGSRGLKDRCRAELALLSRIEKASIDPREKCSLVFQLIDGGPITAIDEALGKAAST
jgi:hypothetical protein